MRIRDLHGHEYAFGISDTLTLASHTIARLHRQGNALTIHNFEIPTGMQGRGIGSALLHELERHARERAITDLRVVRDKSCPAHNRFWTKHGFLHSGTVWHKTLKRGFIA